MRLNINVTIVVVTLYLALAVSLIAIGLYRPAGGLDCPTIGNQIAIGCR